MVAYIIILLMLMDKSLQDAVGNYLLLIIAYIDHVILMEFLSEA